MTTLDVMVLWSNQTQAAAGAGMPAFAQQCVDITNTVYGNSGITPRLRLCRAQAIAHDEQGFDADLSWMSNDATVAALRTQYGADMVALIVENSQYCGLGWIGPGAWSQYTVINRGCAIGNLSFPHELGHNMGCRHNPETDPSGTYNHGYNPAALGLAGWRDVMSYAPGNRNAVLSNPLIQWGGIVAGTTTLHDCARVINANAEVIASYKAAPGPVIPPPPPLPKPPPGKRKPKDLADAILYLQEQTTYGTEITGATITLLEYLSARIRAGKDDPADMQSLADSIRR